MADHFAALDNVDRAVDRIKEAFRPFREAGKDTIESSLRPVEKARLNAVLAYALTSVSHIFLKNRGVDPKDHPWQDELHRVRQYLKKVDDHEKTTEASPPAGATMRVNREAAGRIVEAHTGAARQKRLRDDDDADGDNDREPPSKRSKKQQQKSKRGGKKSKSSDSDAGAGAGAGGGGPVALGTTKKPKKAVGARNAPQPHLDWEQRMEVAVAASKRRRNKRRSKS